jgi:hypothetical protein
MTSKVKSKVTKNTKPCEDCSFYQALKQKLKVSEVLAQTIAKFEDRITDANFSPSVGDYIKLVQMKNELEEASDEAKEIKVTWVEPLTSETEK